MIEPFIHLIERLLTVVNSTKKLMILIILALLGAVIFLTYQVIVTQEVINEFSAPRVERIGSVCYQQRVRRLNRIIAIQFPITPKLIELGVEQNLSGFVISKIPTTKVFNEICSALVDIILDPEIETQLLQNNPQWKKRLQEYYQGLDKDHSVQHRLLKPETQQ